MKKYFELWLTLSIFVAFSKYALSISNISCTEEKFLPYKDYFLPYMVRLRKSYTVNLTKESTLSCSSNFVVECKTEPYSYSYFNKIVYSVLCENITKRKDNYCNNCEYSSDKNSCSALCNVVFAYLEQAHLSGNSTEDSFIYKEITLEDVPFCCSLTIPFLETNGHGNGSTLLSVFDSMPQWCQIGFYIILVLDIILSFMIAFVNGVVILIGTKYSFTRFSGGCFTLSLAISDAMVGFVTHPCTVYNLHRQYQNLLRGKQLPYSASYLVVTGMFQTVSMASSLFTLIMLSIFRYIALVKPLFYHQHRTQLNLYAKKGVALIWLLSLLVGLMTTFRLIPGDKFEIHPMGMTLSKKMSDLYFYHSIIILSTVILWSIFAKIHFALKNNVALFVRNRDKRNGKRVMVRTLKAMIISFSICYMPLAIIQSFHELPSLHFENYERFSPFVNNVWNFSMYVASRLVVLNSFSNCVIYNYKNKFVVLESRKIQYRFFGKRNNSRKRNNSICMEDLTPITQKTTV